MASQSFHQVIAAVNTPGTLYASFTTSQSILTTAASTGASDAFIKIPAGFFKIGTMLEFEFTYAMSWATGNTMILTFKIGAVAAIVSSTFKVTTTGGTTEPLYGKVLAQCEAVGNGTRAQLRSHGFVTGRGICPAGATAGANYTAGMGVASWTEATSALGTGFDNTIDNTLDPQCTMGTSSASNGIQLLQYKVVSPNVAGF